MAGEKLAAAATRLNQVFAGLVKVYVVFIIRVKSYRDSNLENILRIILET